GRATSYVRFSGCQRENSFDSRPRCFRIVRSNPEETVMDTAKVQLLTDMDWVLSRCGRPLPLEGSVVYLYKGFMLQSVVPAANTSSSPSQQIFKTITGDTNWCWRSISCALSATPPAIMAQVTTPDGKVIFNGLIDMTSFAGYGSFRYVFTNEIECPP